MTLFWIISAGLIVLAMAFVGLPLLRTEVSKSITSDELNLAIIKQQLAELDSDLESGILDKERYEAARKDLEKELLRDVSSEIKTPESKASSPIMAATALLIPIAAITIYQLLGSPQIITLLAQQPTHSATQQTAAHQTGKGMENMPPMEELVKKLAEKLEQNPDNLQGWIMLGRSYIALNNYEAAINAYQRAMKIDEQNVGLLLAYAEAIAATNGNNFTGQAAPMVEKAYKLEPNNPNALWLSGILAYQSSQFKTAIERWKSLQGQLNPQSTELESINKAIDDARQQLGLPPEEAPLPSIVKTNKPATKPLSGAASKSLQVEIALSPELQAKAKPDDLLFIYAKAVSGPPMPLAAVRKKVSDLPLSIRLDDSMAMMPQMKLSGFDKVTVGARVSLSGSPTAQSGDLEGEIKPVSPGQSETVKVMINSVHP
jgi:cytochrome c-type biogenesis protein CcmH